MSAVWIRMRAELRGRWRAWFGLMLFVGIFGGAIIAAAAGARRTDTAYPRFLASQNAADMLIGLGFLDPCCAALTFDQLKSPPQVDIATEVMFFAQDPGLVASADPRYGRTFNAYKVLEGRLPDQRRIDEIIAPFEVAKSRGWHVGDVIKESAIAPAIRLRIVGIGAAPGTFPPYLGNRPAFVGTTALYAKYRPTARVGENGYLAAYVGLKHGAADVASYQRDLQRAAGGKVITFAEDQHAVAKNIGRSFGLQASALWLVAAAAAVAFMLVFMQTMSRETFLESTEYPTLRSLGMTERDLVRLGLLRAAVVAIGGALIAVVISTALSPLFPTGLPRVAEPHQGVSLDATAMGTGAAGIALLVCLLSVIPARRAARTESGALGLAELSEGKPSAAVSTMAAAGFSPSAVAGVRLALESGSGRTSVPVRTTILGVTLGIAALATAVSFSASLDHLLATPALYGQTWDGSFSSGSFRSTVVNDVMVPTVRGDPRVIAIGTGTTGLPLQVGRLPVGTIAVDNVVGSVTPVALTGRLPRATGEILIGQRTLRALKAKVGDTVLVGLQGTAQKPLRIVGTGIIPAVSATVRFGEGAMVRYAAVQALCDCEPSPPPDTLFVRFAPGLNPTTTLAAIRRNLRAKSKEAGFDAALPERPTDLVNFGRVQSFPLILAGLLGGLAAAVLAHALVSVIRRRRRDLAILKTLGFLRGQVRRAVAWQATTLVTVALVCGLPLGIILGRVLWTMFANSLGVVAAPRIPIAVVALAVPAGVLIANLIAARPARTAARTPPALALRTE